MEKDNFVTEVVFRKFKDGQVIALFPYNPQNLMGNVGSYMHLGQHSDADYNHVISITKLATEEEYKDLKNELENSVGYNLKVIRRRKYTKFLKEYYILREKYDSIPSIV